MLRAGCVGCCQHSGNLDNGWMLFPRGRVDGANRAGPRSEMELWTASKTRLPPGRSPWMDGWR